MRVAFEALPSSLFTVENQHSLILQQLLTDQRAALESLTAALLKREKLDGGVVRQALDRSRAAA